MSSNPFRFGAPAEGQRLIGRDGECAELLRALGEGRSLALTAARGMGKTSLLLAVLDEWRASGRHAIYVDLFPAINTRRFAEIYASALALEPSRTVESMQEAVQQLVPSFMPRVTITGSGKPGLQLDLWDRDRDIQRLLERILDAPGELAEKTEAPLVVVLDDFEDFAGVAEDSLKQGLAQAIRRQRNVAYVFVLRKEPTARALFAQARSPFHRLAEPVLLDPVPDQALVLGLEERMREAGVRVEVDLLFRLVDLADHAPHYVMLLAHSLYEASHEAGVAAEADLKAALEHVLGVNGYGYRFVWDQLSLHQRNLVLAIAQGYTERLHSQRMVFQLGLGSPSTVSKNLKVLADREILQKTDTAVRFVDPFFGQWLRQRMT